MQIFVERLKWISATVYLELLALSQCLPGPTSTQMSFALGVVQKGVLGGLLTGTGRVHCTCALSEAKLLVTGAERMRSVATAPLTRAEAACTSSWLCSLVAYRSTTITATKH